METDVYPTPPRNVNPPWDDTSRVVRFGLHQLPNLDRGDVGEDGPAASTSASGAGHFPQRGRAESSAGRGNNLAIPPHPPHHHPCQLVLKARATSPQRLREQLPEALTEIELAYRRARDEVLHAAFVDYKLEHAKGPPPVAWGPRRSYFVIVGRQVGVMN
jgi:hypothetical protein